jgi:hypothetical protein
VIGPARRGPVPPTRAPTDGCEPRWPGAAGGRDRQRPRQNLAEVSRRTRRLPRSQKAIANAEAVPGTAAWLFKWPALCLRKRRTRVVR